MITFLPLYSIIIFSLLFCIRWAATVLYRTALLALVPGGGGYNMGKEGGSVFAAKYEGRTPLSTVRHVFLHY